MKSTLPTWIRVLSVLISVILILNGLFLLSIMTYVPEVFSVDSPLYQPHTIASVLESFCRIFFFQAKTLVLGSLMLYAAIRGLRTLLVVTLLISTFLHLVNAIIGLVNHDTILLISALFSTIFIGSLAAGLIYMTRNHKKKK